MEPFNFEINAENLSVSHKAIADYVSKNITRIAYLSIEEIADELKISTATISRFWQNIGFANFKAFKEYVKKNLAVTPAAKIRNTLNEIDENDIPLEIINRQIEHYKDTLNNLSRQELKKATDAIIKAKNVYIYGHGPSEGLAVFLEFRLNRFGINVKRIKQTGSELFEALIHMQKEDVVLLFGFVRKLPESGVILDYSKTVGYTTILFTDRLISEMTCDAVISLYCCRGEKWEYHSMASPLKVIDCLVISIANNLKTDSTNLLEKLNYLRKQYSSELPR